MGSARRHWNLIGRRDATVRSSPPIRHPKVPGNCVFLSFRRCGQEHPVAGRRVPDIACGLEGWNEKKASLIYRAKPFCYLNVVSESRPVRTAQDVSPVWFIGVQFRSAISSLTLIVLVSNSYSLCRAEATYVPPAGTSKI